MTLHQALRVSAASTSVPPARGSWSGPAAATCPGRERPWGDTGADCRTLWRFDEERCPAVPDRRDPRLGLRDEEVRRPRGRRGEPESRHLEHGGGEDPGAREAQRG